MTEREELEKFISDRFDDIGYVKKAVDYDEESKLMNIAYRMKSDIILSILKPYESLDDEFVMFNIFYMKELLIAAMMDCKSLREYVLKCEKMLE